MQSRELLCELSSSQHKSICNLSLAGETSALRVGKQVQGVSVLVDKQNNNPETQT